VTYTDPRARIEVKRDAPLDASNLTLGILALLGSIVVCVLGLLGALAWVT
jgi:hypothetical protein